jgi:biotin carboxyl carrier protein
VKLHLTINGEAKEIELASEAGEVESPEPGVYSILLDGRVYDARVDHTPEGLVVVIAGNRFEVEVRDPRRWSPKSAPGAHGVATLTSPMPGKVVRVLIAEGDAVELGQGILVVEAMKMQNEIKAPRSGRVVSLSAREGATVTAGEPLVTIG